jgi:type III pantothenate kinase
VVDAGTAITLDLLNAHGRHLGGLIVPGAALMAASLLQDTAGIGERAQDISSASMSKSPITAKDTAGALAGGARLATWAAVEHWVSEARRRQGRELEVFVTGGGAVCWRRIPATVQWHFRPALVLEGVLAVANLRS